MFVLNVALVVLLGLLSLERFSVVLFFVLQFQDLVFGFPLVDLALLVFEQFVNLKRVLLALIVRLVLL
jgi:hypothetical protein